MTSFLEQPSRYLFFTGKGGVGKTALACATAIRLADAGKRILLVSTDPASNLDEMLGVPLSQRPTPVPGVDGLSALNIDPEKAADEYRERVIAPYRPIWSEGQVAELREQLSGACTMEIAAFDEFAGCSLVTRAACPSITWCSTPHRPDTRCGCSACRAVDGIPRNRPPGGLVPRSAFGPEDAGGAVRGRARGAGRPRAPPSCWSPARIAPRSARRTAAPASWRSWASRTSNWSSTPCSRRPTAPTRSPSRWRSGDARRCARCPSRLQGLPTDADPPARRSTWSACPPCARCWTMARPRRSREPLRRPSLPSLPPLASLIDDIAAPGHGLIMVMGKGGVGKTTIAAAIAAELAVARPDRAPQHHRSGGAHRGDTRGPARQLEHRAASIPTPRRRPTSTA